MNRNPLERYLARRAITSPWRLEGDRAAPYLGCVVIPALAESPRLFSTLHSLAQNPAQWLCQFLVLVVVNQREDALQADKDDNRETLRRLRQESFPLRLAWVDATGPGLELAAKGGGVGLARRIGLDLALPLVKPEGMLVCLDADTLVEPGYLPALADHFESHREGGAVLPFCHQPGETPGEERAITVYELFLRHYVQGLEAAGSPYAFHCVGSAMACSVKAYLKMGGMSPRSAGEDFYFLQQLQRTSGISRVLGTQVHPAARSSHRVPFGTGKSIARILELGETAQTFYQVVCFRILAEWLALVEDQPAAAADRLLAKAGHIHPELAQYLKLARFPEVWERLGRHAGSEAGLRSHFHEWFDGLKTVRLMHHLSGSYPRMTAERAVGDLLEWCRLPQLSGEREQLNLLRKLQNSLT